MIGNIRYKRNNKWFQFSFTNGLLTIYADRFYSEISDDENEQEFDIESELPYLIGDVSNVYDTVVFILDDEPPDLSSYWSKVSLNVLYYIVLNDKAKGFTDMSFAFPELNYFYKSNKAIEFIDLEDNPKIKILKHDQHNKKFKFDIGNNNVDCLLGIGKTFKSKPDTPLALESTIKFSFKETRNVNFLIELYNLVIKLFSFLCHRTNISVHRIKLTGNCLDGENRGVGYLYVNDNIKEEREDVISKTIEYSLLDIHFPDLINFVADELLYMEQLPIESGQAKIGFGGFILITAAFEWNIKNLSNFKTSDVRSKVKTDTVNVIRKLAEDLRYSHTEVKEIKFISKLINQIDDNLEKKIIFALNEFDSILKQFIDDIFKLNDEPVDTYETIANRISEHRNAFAHGQMDKELDDMIVLDINILEWVNYCIVLKYLGYDDESIFLIIKSIFNRPRRLIFRDE